MTKYFAKRFGSNVLFLLASIIICGIISVVFCEIFVSLIGSITVIVIDVIFSTILCFIIHFAIQRKAINSHTDEDKNIFWKSLRQTKRKVKYHMVFFQLLPYLMFALFFLVAYFCTDSYVSSIFDRITEIKNSHDANSILIAILLRAVIFVPLTQFTFHWIFYIFLFLHYRCPKCGCICSHEYIDSSDYQSRNFTQTKTKENYGTIGKWYTEDGKYIKDETGVTGYTTYQRDVYQSNWTEHFVCIYCGHKDKRNKAKTVEGNWR